MRARGDDGFPGFVRDTAPRLLRTAVLLTGDRHRGEDLLLAALTRTRARWRRTRDGADPAAAVRQLLVDDVLGRRRSARGEQVLVEAPSGSPEAGELRTALLRLSPPVRAALVLRSSDGLGAEETARLLQRPAGAVDVLVAEGVAGLGAGPDPAARLAALADELTRPAPTVSPEAVTDRHRRQRRTRAGSAVGAALLVALLAVGAPRAVDSLAAPAAPAAGGDRIPDAADDPARTAAEAAAAAAAAEQAALPRLRAALGGLGAPLTLRAPAAFDEWLPDGRPPADDTGITDRSTCPPLADVLSQRLGTPVGHWTGALPRGPVGCTWVPEPVPPSQGLSRDRAYVLSVGFVGGRATVERLPVVLAAIGGPGARACPAVDVPGGGTLIGCPGPDDPSGGPLVLAVPDARGAGVWVLSAAARPETGRSPAEALAVLVEAVRPVYG